MQPNFDLIKQRKPRPLGRQLAKRGAGIAIGVQAIAISKKMKELRMEMEEAQSKLPEEKPIDYDYEFVFYEEAIHSFRKVILTLVEKLMRNGISVDFSILEEAKLHIEMFDYLLEKKAKEENGN